MDQAPQGGPSSSPRREGAGPPSTLGGGGCYPAARKHWHRGPFSPRLAALVSRGTRPQSDPGGPTQAAARTMTHAAVANGLPKRSAAHRKRSPSCARTFPVSRLQSPPKRTAAPPGNYEIIKYSGVAIRDPQSGVRFGIPPKARRRGRPRGHPCPSSLRRSHPPVRPSARPSVRPSVRPAGRPATLAPSLAPPSLSLSSLPSSLPPFLGWDGDPTRSSPTVRSGWIRMQCRGPKWAGPGHAGPAQSGALQEAEEDAAVYPLVMHFFFATETHFFATIDFRPFFGQWQGSRIRKDEMATDGPLQNSA
jgi:hypothetical protein